MLMCTACSFKGVSQPCNKTMVVARRRIQDNAGWRSLVVPSRSLKTQRMRISEDNQCICLVWDKATAMDSAAAGIGVRVRMEETEELHLSYLPCVLSLKCFTLICKKSNHHYKGIFCLVML